MSALHAEDPFNYLIELEDGCSDPEMKDEIQTLRLLISILTPFLRFLSERPHRHKEIQEFSEHMHNEVRKVHRSFKPSLRQRLVPVQNLVAAHLTAMRIVKEDIARIVTLHSAPYFWGYESQWVTRFLQSLLQNLKDISVISKAQRTISISQREGLAAVEEMLKYLQTFMCLIFVPYSKSEQFIDSAGRLAVEISYTLFLCFVDDEFVAGDYMKEHILPEHRRKINSLLIELKEVRDEGCDSIELPDKNLTTREHVLGFIDFLISKLVPLSTKATFMDEVKVQLQIVSDELRFIRSTFMEMLLQNTIREIEFLNLSIATLIVDTGVLIYFSPDNVGEEELTWANYWSLGLHDLLEAVQTVQQQATDLFNKYLPQSLQSSCPSSNDLEFVDFLISKLEEVMLSGAASVHPLKHQIVMVSEEMVTLRKCLSEVVQLMGSSQVEFLLSRFRLAAYQAKCILDSLMAGEGSLWLHKLGIFVITNDIKVMHKEVRTILKMNLDSGDHSISKASVRASTQVHQPPFINAPGCSKDGMQINIEEDADKLVGRKDAVTEIVGLLTEGSSQLKILSIVGMAGLGKTTLTNAVYKHPSVVTYFEVCAWGSLSQVYQKETLLSSILGQICQVHANQSHDISGEDVGQMLYQSLKRRKYLIVLDNIWDIKAWDDLRLCFPDDGNGSRILFTTRSHAVAGQANSFSYALRLLSNEESCELLWLKLFKGATNCPQELSSISKRIAYSCKGLPLAVVLIAGTLKRTKKVTHSWEKVAKNFIRSGSLQKQIWDILEVSYKLLPGHLKSCFWYFGTFPEGTTISVSKLIRLWISEGFVQLPNTGRRSLVQEAKGYLNDLN